MGERNVSSPYIGGWIEWTKAHGTFSLSYRGIEFALAKLDKAASEPCGSHIGVKGQSSSDEGSTILDFSDHVREGDGPEAECGWIIPSEFDCASGQPGRFGGFLFTVDYPAILLSHRVAKRGLRIGACKIWITLQGHRER